MTRPFLRLLVTVLLRLTCLLAVVTLALAVGFAAGWNAHITLAASSHHRWMAPPLPGDLALYEPEGGAAHEAARWLLRDTRPSLTVPASGWAALYESDPSAAGRYATLLRDQGDGAGRVPASGGLTGYATWYATGPDCLCAAAGPALRVGAWRGSTVTVNGLRVRLVDACWCIDRHGQPTLLDLSDETVTALGLDPRRGVYAVEVRP